MATYNPSDFTTSNKSYGVNGIPDGARQWYKEDNGTFRAFQSEQEMIDYFPSGISREGHYVMTAIIGGEVIDYTWDGDTPVPKFSWGKINGSVTNQADLVEYVTGQIANIQDDLQGQIDELDTEIAAAVSGYRGELAIADIPSLDGFYIATESGTYTNAGGIVTDLTDGINFISKIGNDYALILIPITIETITILGDNIFNKNNLINDQFINTGSGAIVNGSTAVGFKTSVIPLDVTKTHITVSGLINTSGKAYRFELANGGLVSWAAFSNTTQTLSIPDTAAQFRLCVKRDTDPDTAVDTVMINYGTTALPYAEYTSETLANKINTFEILAAALKEGATIDGNEIALTEDIPTLETINYSQLFDKDTIAGDNISRDITINGVFNDVFVASTGSLTTSGTAAGWVVANILVSDSQSFISLSGLQLPSGRYYRFINSSGVRIADHTASDQYASMQVTFSIPDTAVALQINVKRDSTSADIIDTVMANYGFQKFPFEPYGVKEISEINNTPLVSTINGFVDNGDSTTQGDIVAMIDAWPKLLSDRTGIGFVNIGSNGSTAGAITARMGGEVPKITINGGTLIPGSYAACTFLDINPCDGSGQISSIAAYAVLPDGTRCMGRIHRTSGFMADADYSGETDVTGLVLRLFSYDGELYRDYIHLLGMGINDESAIVAGTKTIDTIKQYYRNAVSCVAKCYVWGILDRGVNEANPVGTPVTDDEKIGRYIHDMRAWFPTELGTKYIPVAEYLSTQQALNDAVIYNPSFNPSQTADLAAIAVNRIPPSFRTSSNSVHLNEMGHWLQALFMYKHLSYYES